MRNVSRRELPRTPQELSARPRTKSAEGKRKSDVFVGGQTPSDVAAERAFVREAIRVNIAAVKKENPVGAQDKLKALALSPFTFFRGTADLFYRRYDVKADKTPVVRAHGDAHPANFGVAKGTDGALHFGINDFDEAYPAPAGCDLARASTGLVLAARADKMGSDAEQTIVAALRAGYRDELGKIRDGKGERAPFLQHDMADVIDGLFASADGKSREEMLKKYTKASHFRASDDVRPSPARVAALQKVVDVLAARVGGELPKGYFNVLDVATKTGSGIASIGLDRTWVLLRGKSDDPKEHVILELKERAAPVLAAFVAKPAMDDKEIAAYAAAQRSAFNRLSGAVTFDGRAYWARERVPKEAALDLAKVSPQDLRKYADEMGRVLAATHTQSASGAPSSRIAKALLTAAPDTVADRGPALADRMTADYALFAAQYRKGTFA